jgi:hypothetical protein
MNLEKLINQILNEENVAGGEMSALVSPNSTSVSSQFSGPQVYNPGDNRRAKPLFKKIQKRPALQKNSKKRKK